MVACILKDVGSMRLSGWFRRSCNPDPYPDRGTVGESLRGSDGSVVLPASTRESSLVAADITVTVINMGTFVPLCTLLPIPDTVTPSHIISLIRDFKEPDYSNGEDSAHGGQMSKPISVHSDL